MTNSLDRLFAAVQEARDRNPSVSRTSKLFRNSVQKMAKKLAEEAIEVGLDAVQINRESVILESADVLYHLAVIWAECGISSADVMGEIDGGSASTASPRNFPSRLSRRRCGAWRHGRRGGRWFPEMQPPAERPQGLGRR